MVAGYLVPTGLTKRHAHRTLEPTYTHLANCAWRRCDMKALLSRLFRSAPAEKPDAGMPPIRPDTAFFAIGDIHGAGALVPKLLDQIESYGPEPHPIVFLGDYVDRGDRSADTLRLLYELSQSDDRPLLFLRGNHEQMLLDFLDAPAVSGPFWLSVGGRQTLASFGLAGDGAYMSAKELHTLRDRFRSALGPDLENWLRNLRLYWRNGNVFVSHSGTDPTRRIDEQTPETLLWAEGSNPPTARNDGIWCIQGHVIVEAAEARKGRVFLDTGAYATGRLSAGFIDISGVRFLST